MKRYVCSICGYVYEEEKGIPEKGIGPGTRWDDLPAGWVCPLCGAPKSAFRMEGEVQKETAPIVFEEEEAREMSFAELSAVCSNLALGCEKQQLSREQELFGQLARYFKTRAVTKPAEGFGDLLEKVNGNLEREYAAANGAANDAGDRGALRVLVWSEKVTRLLGSLLERFEKEGGDFLIHTNVYVCDICGFIFVGENPPEICPVCKVPSFKLLKVERR